MLTIEEWVKKQDADFFDDPEWYDIVERIAALLNKDSAPTAEGTGGS